MRNSFGLALLLAAAAAAQTRLDPRSTMHITFPDDSPVTVVSADWGESTASARGGALLLDLRTSLSLRNSSNRHVRGVTLLVTAQEVTPGGKASVSVPSLNIAPNENFPVRIDLSLLRPLQAGAGPLVEIGLDGVLFDDLSFYGPNRLNCRRSMTVWELEARRDRKYFRDLLDQGGPNALRQGMLASLARQAERAGSGARIAQAGPATNVGSEREVRLAFVRAPGAPVEPVGGLARVARDQLRRPRIYLRNVTDKPVRALEIGWMVKDSAGREFVSGAIPIELSLEPRQSTNVLQDTAFKFSQSNGRPIAISEVSAFVNSVEFADGAMWVPRRGPRPLTSSPEEQRLAEMYRKRGLDAVAEELKKF
ncbi:MAG: hypothetical protein HYZ57_04770 [Acidobacteria bacterium]|nr:hypothetical protein [Acidobacteriota bacterium]MBI3279137.1 hypothetical protein [Acidobacteriota bacterium]